MLLQLRGFSTLRNPLEDSPPGINRSEIFRLCELGFCLAQEQYATRFQCIMQSLQDLPLRVRIEIDQDVTANYHVTVGDRGIAHKVTAPENHQPPDIPIDPQRVRTVEIPI